MRIFILLLSLLATIGILNAADLDTSKVYSRLKKYSNLQGPVKQLRISNSTQSLDSNITSEWVNDHWQPYEKEEFFYDAENRLTLVYNYSMDQISGEWILNAKSEIEYPLNSTRAIYYAWDDNLKEFSESYLMETSFNDQGKKTTEIFYYHDGIDWLIDEKSEYFYLSNGNLKEEIQYYGIVDIWIEEEKTEYTYYAGQLLESEINYEYDGVWYPVFKENYIFNGDLPVARQSFDYEGPDVDSFLVEELEFFFDINGNPVTEIFSGDWDQEKIEYIYDLSYEMTDITFPGLSLFIPQISSNILNKPLGYTSYYPGTSGWEPNRREIYFYSDEIITSVDTKMKSSFKLYPNPAVNYSTITSEFPGVKGELKVLDLNGNELIKQDYFSGLPIQTSQLKPGVYIIYFQNPDTNFKEKLMVE